MTNSSELSVSELSTQVRENVRRRREAGDYPADLELRLNEHFERILKLRSKESDCDLGEEIVNWRARARFEPKKVNYRSRIPGLGIVHRIGGRLSRRDTLSLSTQMLDSVYEIVSEINKQLPTDAGSLKSGIQSELETQIDALYEQCGKLVRKCQNNEAEIAELKAHISQLSKQQDLGQ